MEHSETLLYYIRLLSIPSSYTTRTDLHRALTLLESASRSNTIVDRTAILEIRASILSQIDEEDEGKDAWLALLKKNVDCLDYFYGYLAHHGIYDPDAVEKDAEQAITLLKELSDIHPKATTPRRLLLTYLPASDQEFVQRTETYLREGLRKGIPSLFSDVKALYRDAAKLKIIGEAVEKLLKEFEGNEPDKDPTVYIWTLYFLSSHHLYISKLNANSDQTSSFAHIEKALSYLTTALEHTPTLPDLLTLHSRILKICGDYLGSARAANEARLLDGQDRWLNGRCGKMRLRCSIHGGEIGKTMIDSVGKVVGVFTKVGHCYFVKLAKLDSSLVERCTITFI